MQTVKYKEVKGKKIVVGFDNLQLDPVSTRKKAKEIIGETDILERIVEAKAAVKEAENVKKMFKLIQVVKALQVDYGQAFRKILKANPVYFECRKNEQPISEEGLENLKVAVSKAKEDQLVTIEGKLVKMPKE